MKNKILKNIGTLVLGAGLNFNSYSQNSKLSENSRVLIYGESDHRSVLAKQYAINSIDSLKKQGYNYFAVELSKEYDESYKASCFNLEDSNAEIGPNINYLLYGDPLQKLLILSNSFYRKGFNVELIDTFADDTQSLRGNRFNYRDLNMAENLLRIFMKDSEAKVVVYVGSFHAQEIENISDMVYILKKNKKISHSSLPLAGLLKTVAGIDPQTIYLKDEEIFYGELENYLESQTKYFDKTIYLGK